ncbi:hypothetical protein Plec18167_004655 [Paecilomyces lecythidis]|uniref:Probable beta-glucosidase G n=1 Tax=Paecilomyces lecythidis TaxID=3004212 RepID=A0ABR3XNY0_9EURO
MRVNTVAISSLLSVISPLVDGHYAKDDWHPAPNATGSGDWENAFSQAKSFTEKLNLTEKIFLVTGVDGPCVGNIPAIECLGFKGICLQDGPLAIRQASFASVFSAGVSTAATWDRELMYQRGAAIGQEFVGKGAHVMLGPVSGPLGRSALGGRNWEGFSPDPYLTGVAMYETITAAQSQGIQACAKHFIGYEQETQRVPSVNDDGITIQAVSSNINDRTLHELYLWPFADSVKAGVASVMCSYNRLNETYACENSHTLNEILKTELGFQGYVVSDWGATHSGVKSILAGLDMNMPGPLGSSDSSVASWWGHNITTMINNGSVSESKLDDMIRRILTPYYYLQQNSAAYPTIDIDTAQLSAGVTGSDVPAYQHPFNLGTNTDKNRDVRNDHSSLIRQLGTASSVLLKNSKNTLPLTSPGRLALFGNDAVDVTGGPYDPQNVFGVQAVGGGSGTGRLASLVSPLEAIKMRLPSASIQYITDNSLITDDEISSIYPAPDVCLVFLKTFATEGADRTNLLCDYNSTQVVEIVTSSGSCANTIVITHSPGINLLPWADNENVTAIIASHFSGEQAGNSITDILFGDVNPSGKLPYTIAYNAEDYNAPIVNFTGSDDPNAWQSNFTEGLMIDYRHFDHNNITPRYEFGFGLSYTTFSLSNIGIGKVSTSDLDAYPPGPGTEVPPPGGNSALYDVVAIITAEITNSGSVPGAAVPQLYLSFPTDSGDAELSSTTTPKKVLRGFEKTPVLAPGESAALRFEIKRRDISYWNVENQDWKIPQGSFGISVGQSSRGISLIGQISFL